MATTKRMTRVESRSRTRALVLDAAAQVFAARGFGGASMEEIAAEAGFTRGAVYSNFADKSELFLAVLEERENRRADEVRAIYESADSPADFFRDLNAAEDDRNVDAKAWVMLRLEFWLYAMRHPDVRAALVARSRASIAALEPAIQGVLDAVGVEPPRPISEMAQIIQSLDDGLTMLCLLDPEGVRPDLYFDTMGLLLEARHGPRPVRRRGERAGRSDRDRRGRARARARRGRRRTASPDRLRFRCDRSPTCRADRAAPARLPDPRRGAAPRACAADHPRRRCHVDPPPVRAGDCGGRRTRRGALHRAARPRRAGRGASRLPHRSPITACSPNGSRC